MTMPTVGRKVWFWPSENETFMNCIDHEQPFDATVLFVHNERSINLLVVDHRGHAHAQHSVALIQEGDAKPEDEAYAEWMPYQIKQHAKQAAEETKQG